MTTSNDSKDDCVCGGCLTGTPCCNSTSPIKTDALYGTYVYAAPDTQPSQTAEPSPFIFTSDTPNTVLLEELVKDLLDRVQKLEAQYQQLAGELAAKLLADVDSVIDIQTDIGHILDIVRSNEKK